MPPGSTFVNLIAGIVALASNLVVNVILAPFLVSTLGPEAVGFVGLVNSFVGVSSVLTASLNLMAGRYVAIAVHQGRNTEAQILFNSVIAANAVFVALYCVGCAALVLRVEQLFQVSPHLIHDVQLAFVAMFANLAVTSIASVFGSGALVRNRLDLASLRDIASQMVRVGAIVVLFALFEPQIHFVGLGTFAGGLFLLCSNVLLARKLLPEVHLRVADVRLSSTLLLLGAGSSYLMNGLGGFLMNDAGLLLANVWLGDSAMGMYALARTIPVALLSVAAVVSRVFAPDFIRLHAGDDYIALADRLVTAMKGVALVMCVPFAGFVALGRSFFSLWLPTMSDVEVNQIYIVSIIIVGGVVADAFTSPCFQVFVATGRIWVPTMVSFGIGAVNVVAVSVVLTGSQYGLFGIASIGMILVTLRSIFLPLYAARALGVDSGPFLRQLARSATGFVFVLACCGVVSQMLTLSKWGTLLVACGACAVMGYGLSFAVLLNQRERRMAWQRLDAIVHRIKGS